MAHQGSTKDIKKAIIERRKSDLPHGMVKALKQLRHRVPPNTPPELAAIADSAIVTLYEVSVGKGSFRQNPSRVKAAMALREEICGPVARDINVNARLTYEQLVIQAAVKAEEKLLEASNSDEDVGV